MKLFECSHCRQLIFFENTYCEKCGYPLGFDSKELQLFTLRDEGNNFFSLFSNSGGPLYRYCANYQHGVCNWLIADNSLIPFCRACELNHIIPNISKPAYLERWKIIENAKHRLLYALLSMHLNVLNKIKDPKKGLSFDFLSEEDAKDNKKIFTGHNLGLITINIAEADDIEREMARRAMNESYRTVLGHFRHEVGHYYWDRLVDDKGNQEAFRNLFGDERADYSKALQEHYENGPQAGWNNQYISAYASTHPWEDWAETWAHYMLILDTLQTAYSFGISIHPVIAGTSGNLSTNIKTDSYSAQYFNDILQMWLPLTFALNSLNRSMGLRDPYPFIISEKVTQKLRFIHEVCFAARQD